MSSQGDPQPTPSEKPARSDMPRVVSIVLVVVLMGTGLLALQNCGESAPPPQTPIPPIPHPSATATTPPPVPTPPPPSNYPPPAT